ncbi:MAG: leucine-rich repeat domain-containing protein [Promethearchaeota archaeon]
MVKKKKIEKAIILGNNYFSKESYTEAEQCYKKASELDPNNVIVWISLGGTYNALKNYTEAERCLKKASELDPNNVILWDKYGDYWLKKEEVKFLLDFEKIYRKEITFVDYTEELNEKGVIIENSLGNFRITGLNYNDCGLNYIPKSIENLLFLRYLDISGNNIEVLPESIRKLDDLEILKISNNPIKNLPEWGGNFPKLIELSINGIKLSKSQDTFPEWIENLTSLKYLGVNDTGINNIPDWIQNMENLEYLDISWNPILEIPDFLGEMSNLKGIEFHQDPIKNVHDRIRAPTVIVSEAVFKKLSLEPSSWEVRTRTKDDMIEYNQLCELILSENEPEKNVLIFKKEYDILTEILKHERRLSAFDIIVKNHHIIKLELNGSDDKPAFIPESINELKYLQYFNIFSSDITPLPESLGDLKEMVTMSILSWNLETLPKSFKNLTNLQYLSLGDHNSNYRGGNFYDVPEQIRYLKKLKYLDLSHNEYITELPEWLGKMHNLKQIYVCDCNIEEVPESLDQKLTFEY